MTMRIEQRDGRAERVTLDVGHDLDGCFYDFALGYWSGCCRLGLIDGDPNRLPPELAAKRWEFYEDHGHDLATFIANCNQAADAGLLWDGPVMRGGKAAWQRILENGHRIHVKTDRSFGSHPVASEVGTRMWIGHEQLWLHSITFGPDKTAGPAVDIMLEDKLSNYDALDDAGVYVWLFDRPWNQDPGDHRRRVFNHAEWVTRVEVLAERKAQAAATITAPASETARVFA